MFGFIKTLIYIAVIICVGAGFFAWSYRVPITSHLLSHAINNPLVLQDVDISLSLSRINGKNVAILNPNDPVSQDAIRTKRLELKIKLFSLFTDTIIIEEIVMDKVEFFMDMYNVTGSDSNWKQIIQNIENKRIRNERLGKNVKKVLIKKIVLQDLNFTYRNPVLTDGKIRSLKKIDQFELDNVGKGHSLDAGQFVELISRVLIKQFTTLTGYSDIIRSLPRLPLNLLKNIFITEDGVESPLEEFFELPGKIIKDTGTFFKNLFSPNKKNEEDAA